MTRHGKTRQRRSEGRLGRILRRFLVGPPEELEAPASGLEPYDVNMPQMLYPEHTPMRNQIPKQTGPQASLEAEGYLREYIHPIVGDRPFDQDEERYCAEHENWVCDVAAEAHGLFPPPDDHTRFDLIREHPYLPEGTGIIYRHEPIPVTPGERDHGDERPAGQMDTVGDGADGPGGGGLRLRPVVHPRVLPGGDTSPERGIPQDAPAERGLAHVRGWFDPAPPAEEGSQALDAGSRARPGGYRNPDS